MSAQNTIKGTPPASVGPQERIPFRTTMNLHNDQRKYRLQQRRKDRSSRKMMQTKGRPPLITLAALRLYIASESDTGEKLTATEV